MARIGTSTGSTPAFSIPPFTGATRGLLVVHLLCFFVLAALQFALPSLAGLLLLHLGFFPGHFVGGEVWQVATYSFLDLGFINTIFAMSSLWYSGIFLEDSFGSRWLIELYLAASVGGALIAMLISYTHLLGMSPAFSFGLGPWGPIFALLVAIGYFYPDLEINFFVLRMKAKVMVMLYIVLFSAEMVTRRDLFGAALALSGGLAGYAYCRLAPKRGFGFGRRVSEWAYSLRNNYYRSKRRNAAKKFEVYMKGQNRSVHFDKDGRYVEPDERDPNGRDPNDKRWMN